MSRKMNLGKPMQMIRFRSQLSRRLFFGLSCVGLDIGADRQLRGQATSWNGGGIRFKLMREMKNAFLLATTPDSGKLCIWIPERPVWRVSGLVRGGRSLDHDSKASGLLTIVEIGTGKEIYSAPLMGEPMDFSFFLGGDRVYGITTRHTVPGKLPDRMAMVLNLRTGDIERLAAPYTADTFSYCALWDRNLLGVRSDGEIVRAEWPGLREIARGRTDGSSGVPSFTSNRRRFIQVVGQSLLCRNTEDFGVLWQRPIDASIDRRLTTNDLGVPGPSLAVVRRCFSADGSTVAIGARSDHHQGAPVRFYTEILNGNDGSLIARWPEDPGDGIALSTDGKLLAIAGLTQRGSELEAAVRIHEIPSGRDVAVIVHDRVASSRRLGASLNGRFGFSADGKYFISANRHITKIWEMVRG